MEINLAAQSKSTWRDFMHLAFLTKLSISFFSHRDLLKIILSSNLNVFFPAYCEGLTGSNCCKVIQRTHYPTAKRSFEYYFILQKMLCFISCACQDDVSELSVPRGTQVNFFMHLPQFLVFLQAAVI